MSLPAYDSSRTKPILYDGVRVARTLNDLQAAFAVRTAVYMEGQDCPYNEEFDGNDFTATHLVYYKQGEPVGTVRIRYFADFVKFERVAVLKRHRNSRAAFIMVKAAIEFVRKKSYTKIYGTIQEGLEKFWEYFGGRALNRSDNLKFSERSYSEILIEVPPHEEPLKLESDPFVLMAPEGQWDMTGILERSAVRGSVPSEHVARKRTAERVL